VLEQRVESLEDILTTTNNPVPVHPSAIPNYLQANDVTPIQAPGSTTSFASRKKTSRSSTTPEDTSEQLPGDASRAHDPIDAGLLNETQANMQLDELQHSFF
jgi:hypothetical protein